MLQNVTCRMLRRMPSCASALLMGCSSGSLSRAGEYEASGPVLAYLMAGPQAFTRHNLNLHDNHVAKPPELQSHRHTGIHVIFDAV